MIFISERGSLTFAENVMNRDGVTWSVGIGQSECFPIEYCVGCRLVMSDLYRVFTSDDLKYGISHS